MINETSGFYKNENGQLVYGENFVYGVEFTNLFRENKDNYTYPIGGWYWFDSEEEARQFLNLPIENNLSFNFTPTNPYI